MARPRNRDCVTLFRSLWRARHRVPTGVAGRPRVPSARQRNCHYPGVGWSWLSDFARFDNDRSLVHRTSDDVALNPNSSPGRMYRSPGRMYR
jgi:hypothetical protein